VSIIGRAHPERDEGAVDRALQGAADELYYAACAAFDAKVRGYGEKHAEESAQHARAVTFFAVSKVADYDVCSLDYALERVRERNLPPLEARRAYYEALLDYVNLSPEEEPA
jgi:hypothetical protein